jgi:hypothetical protein
MIKFIMDCGYTVVDHQDGTFTVTDSLNDPDYGWRIVKSATALEETVEMLTLVKG